MRVQLNLRMFNVQRLDNADLYDKPNAQEEPAKDLHQGTPRSHNQHRLCYFHHHNRIYNYILVNATLFSSFVLLCPSLKQS